MFLRRLLAETVSNTGDSKAKGSRIYVCVCVREKIHICGYIWLPCHGSLSTWG